MLWLRTNYNVNPANKDLNVAGGQTEDDILHMASYIKTFRQMLELHRLISKGHRGFEPRATTLTTAICNLKTLCIVFEEHHLCDFRFQMFLSFKTAASYITKGIQGLTMAVKIGGWIQTFQVCMCVRTHSNTQSMPWGTGEDGLPLSVFWIILQSIDYIHYR